MGTEDGPVTNIGGAALPVFLDESNPRVAACPAMLVYADAVAEQKIGSPALPIKFLAAGEGLVNGVVKVSTVSAVYQAQTHVGIFLYGDDGTANFDRLSARAL